ncbi:MAG TPA: hypothetical protein VFN39_05215 [Gemmatimonadaceae bacterium]|nr:hypothetical protein [Gemmatimonadaceae bacterium]
MTRWLLAAIIGLMIAALHYGRSLRGSPEGAAPGARLFGLDPRLVAATLRALAAMIVAAMLLSAPSGRAHSQRPLVAVDASASWTRGDSALVAWRKGVVAALPAAAGDSMLLFGDSLRRDVKLPGRPTDRHSRIAPVLDAARDEHRALVVVSDGEFSDGGTLPAGTRLTIIPRPAVTDVAVASLVAPARVAPGDTMPVRVTIRTGGQPVTDAVMTISFAGGAPATVRSGPLGIFAERELTASVVAPRGEREELLRAAVTVAGDVEPRNDTLATIIEITRAPVAVLVSSSPDPDARAALEALSGALSARPRGFYQVAPGAWRDATTLRAVGAAEVRGAAAAAPLLVLHGDTAVFGAPSQLARSALVLMVPGDAGDVDWRAAARDDSPLAPSLAGIAWDSIPPIELPAAAPRGDWIALEGRGIGAAARPVVVGGDANGRRHLVVAASGLWRWRARGGPARDAYDALWGAIADWSTSVAVDARPALPARRWLREGQAVEWLRTGADSLVSVTLRAATDTTPRPLMLRFPGDARTVTTPALLPGRYIAALRGGSASFVVNASEELLPVRPPSHTVARGDPPSGIPAPPLAARWWTYVLALAALCGEWIIRRRAGLR